MRGSCRGIGCAPNTRHATADNANEIAYSTKAPSYDPCRSYISPPSGGSSTSTNVSAASSDPDTVANDAAPKVRAVTSGLSEAQRVKKIVEVAALSIAAGNAVAGILQSHGEQEENVGYLNDILETAENPEERVARDHERTLRPWGRPTGGR